MKKIIFVRKIFLILFILLVIIIAGQNTNTITAKILFWNLNGSLFLFLTIAVLIGIIIGIIFNFSNKENKRKTTK